MFANQMDKTMEIYVEDMLMKCVQANDHLEHLDEMFSIQRSTRWSWTQTNACSKYPLINFYVI